MPDAQTISNDNNGVDGGGRRLPWRIVHLLREAKIGDLSTQTSGDAESPNVSASLYDQVVTLAKILTRRYNGKDIWDMVCEIHDRTVSGK